MLDRSTVGDNTVRMIAECIGAVSLGIWLYLVFARGGFWRMRVDEFHLGRQALPRRRIAVIVPARNEAELLARTLQSLLQQNYAGSTHVFLVDDHSTDGTAEVALRAAREAGCPDRLTVIQANPLPRGWTGKL